MSESLTVESRKTQWEERILGEVCKISSGNSAPQNDDAFKNGTTPFIRTSDVGKIKVGRISSSRDYINQATLGKMKLQVQGTILLPKSGASTFLNHRVILDCEACVSSHLATIKTESDKIYDKYLFYFLITVKAQDLIQDHSYPSLRISDLSKIRIKFPPLEEQKRIVDVLDKAFETIDKAIANTEANLASTKELFQSVLNDTFENKGDDWEEKTLGEVCELVNGSTPKTKVLEYWNGDHCWITPAEMNNNNDPYKNNTKRKITDAGLSSCSTTLMPINSVILSSRAPIGHLIINTVEMAFNQGCKGLIPKGQISYKFLYYFLLGKNNYLNSLGTGTTFLELSGKVLKNVLIPYPESLEEQKRIVDVLDSLSTKTKQLEALYENKLASLKELKQSLLQKAFSGAL